MEILFSWSLWIGSFHFPGPRGVSSTLARDAQRSMQGDHNVFHYVKCLLQAHVIELQRDFLRTIKVTVFSVNENMK